MGMSASQARFLALTARISDVEFKSQQISNQKMRLADESEAASKSYTEALNKTKLQFKSYPEGKETIRDLDSSTINESGYVLKDKSGNDVKFSYSASQLSEMIESGEYYLVNPAKDDDNDKKPDRISVSSEYSLMYTSIDKVDLAKAEAEYNAESAKINRKEKLLDNDLKALDTEHSALTTEQESIKSLIGDNVEKSFNLFS